MILERVRDAARRLGARVHSVLGTALAGGAAGLLLAVAAPVPVEPFLPETAPWVNRMVTIASGAFLGWWVGLLLGIVWLAVRPRRR
jgi:hypothetical protein